MKKYDESPLGKLSNEKLDDYLSYMEHDFSNQDIQQVVEETLRKSRQSEHWFDKFRRHPKALLVVVAFILFVLIPGSVYAANKIWQTYFEKNNYSTNLTIQKTKDSVEPSTVASQPSEEKFYRLDMTYLPENLGPIPQNEGEVPMKFWDANSQDSKDSISTILVKIQDQNEFESRYTKEAEELVLGGHSAWLITKEGQYNSDIDREAYILFEEEGYVLFLMISEGINDEELKKIISGAELIESTADYASYYTTDLASRFDEEVFHVDENGNIREGESTLPPQKVSVNSSVIKNLNEKITFKNPTDVVDEHSYVQEAEMSMTVNKVTVYDQWKDITDIQNDVSINNRLTYMKDEGIVDDTGNFISYEVKNYQRGNGVDTVDELKSTEKQTLKFVSLSITLENQSEFDLQDYFSQSQLLALKRKGDYYTYKYEDEDDKYSTPTHFSGSNFYELVYIDQSGKDVKGYYNIGDLPKHSKRNLTIGYFIPEKDVKNLFLEENSYEYSVLGKRNIIQLFEK